MEGQEFRFTFPLKPCPFCNKWTASICENPSAHKAAQEGGDHAETKT